MQYYCSTGQSSDLDCDVLWIRFAVTVVTTGLADLVLSVTGNPGVVGFYRTFMQTLHSRCGYQHPVWAVSHAGHCAPPASMDMIEGTHGSAHRREEQLVRVF